MAGLDERFGGIGCVEVVRYCRYSCAADRRLDYRSGVEKRMTCGTSEESHYWVRQDAMAWGLAEHSILWCCGGPMLKNPARIALVGASAELFGGGRRCCKR